jgi:hypothetical protein
MGDSRSRLARTKRDPISKITRAKKKKKKGLEVWLTKS